MPKNSIEHPNLEKFVHDTTECAGYQIRCIVQAEIKAKKAMEAAENQAAGTSGAAGETGDATPSGRPTASGRSLRSKTTTAEQTEEEDQLAGSKGPFPSGTFFFITFNN